MRPTRHTRQRQAVLDVLRGTRTHPDAAWVFQEVRRSLPNISLATVYRALDVLTQEGLVMTIERAGERTRYDYMHENHHHAVCRVCGTIFDVQAMPEPDEQTLPLPAGFRLTNVVLEFHGVCNDCADEPIPVPRIW